MRSRPGASAKKSSLLFGSKDIVEGEVSIVLGMCRKKWGLILMPCGGTGFSAGFSAEFSGAHKGPVQLESNRADWKLQGALPTCVNNYDHDRHLDSTDGNDASKSHTWQEDLLMVTILMMPAPWCRRC